MHRCYSKLSVCLLQGGQTILTIQPGHGKGGAKGTDLQFRAQKSIRSMLSCLCCCTSYYRMYYVHHTIHRVQWHKDMSIKS